MKLAEALIERKELQSKVARLKQRLLNNALVQEGSVPNEDPKVLITDLEKTLDRLRDVIDRINKTNVSVSVDGSTLSEMINKRDLMITRIAIMREFLEKASSRVDRYTRNEILVLSTVDVEPYQTT